MINKISNQAFEARYKGIRSRLITPLGIALIHKKINLLKKGSLFPDVLINELEEYAKRNELVKSDIYIQENSIHKCCPNCLKAHALAKAKELDVGEETLNHISKFLKGDVGHNGYYLDEDELIKIED